MLTDKVIKVDETEIAFIELQHSEETVKVLMLIREETFTDFVIKAFGRWEPTIQTAIVKENIRGNMPCLIVRGEETIGSICLGISEDNYLEISLFGILSKWQNKGIGSAIINNLLHASRLRESGIRLSVLKHNTGAIRFYKRLGLTIKSETDNEYFMSREVSTLVEEDKNA